MKRINLNYLIFFLILVIFFLNIFSRRESKADITYFYPQNCLGSFINPEKASNKKEVEDLELINESNAAVYLGGFKEIYCGNFQGIIEKGEIKRINLKFNLILTEERKETIIKQPPSTSSENIIEKIIPPKEIEIIPKNEFISTSSEIQSLFLFNFVRAENEKNEENQSFQENLDYKKEIITSSQENLSDSKIISSSSLNYFDIFYTLDSQNWHYLGSLTNENWQKANFEISVQDWLEIPKIQIKIQSNPSIEKIPYLYLESLWLEIEYLTISKNKKEEKYISPYCQELNEKLSKYYEKIKNVTSSDLKIDSNSYLTEFQRKEKGKILIEKDNNIDLIFSKKLQEKIEAYQLKIEENYEFWLYDKDKEICQKLENLNLQNLPIGFYENIFFYLDENNVLNGYDLISAKKFSLTFENNLKINIIQRKEIMIKLFNNSLIFEEKENEFEN
ncbi:MAG: hypothetical protein NZ866_00630 [Patescibacteria group bacterium]|nr:hypothetical protein [Patescibacteria group bacterium]